MKQSTLAHLRRSARRTPCSGALAAACVLICAFGAPGFSAPAHSKRRAAEAYQHALKLRSALRRRSAPAPESYERVARAFQAVYRADPSYTQTPAALAAAAEVYQEMGRRFASDRYYSRAVAADQFLAAQYPGSRLAIDAMYDAADICRTDLENPIAARALYKQFLKVYPHSRHAPEARREIAAVDHQLGRQLGRRLRSGSGAGASSSRWAADSRSAAPVPVSIETEAIPDRAPNPAPLGSSRNGASGGLREVESIRHWVGPNYTRVVIRLGGKVTFNATQLEHPPRLVFDLAGTRLSPGLARKVLAVQDGFLERIRAAQFQPTVTRVVLDVPYIEDYSVFSLPDPFRLVIDIHGARNPALAGAGKTVTSGTPVSLSRNAEALNASRAQPERPLAEEPDGAAASPLIFPGEASPAGTVGRRRANSAANRASDALPDNAVVATLAAPPATLDGASPTLTRVLGLKIRRIVIDAGHGGHDTGTIGPTGVEEKNVVLDVALRLRKLVEHRMGCQVIMTRSTDTFIPLEERTAIANEYGADLFVSIHANSSPDTSARGVEVYYLNFTSDPEALALAARENATSRESVYQLQSLIKKIALSEKVDESREFAKIVDGRLVSYMDEHADEQPNRGVKKAPFVVLIGANMPSILAEISFLSNPSDERRLRSGAYREEIAVGLYRGILRYANSLGTLRVAQR
ncbi:MAG: N-acetylmuramoyl-L-alanine amidase [Terriglobia bacterium]